MLLVLMVCIFKRAFGMQLIIRLVPLVPLLYTDLESPYPASRPAQPNFNIRFYYNRSGWVLRPWSTSNTA